MSKIIGIASAVASALCWGGATVMSKGVLDSLDPIVLLSVQLGGSLVFVWTLIGILRIKTRSSFSTVKISTLGLLEPGLAYLLGLIGLAWVPASTASLIQATEALMIAVLCVVFLRERLKPQFWALSVAALFGIGLVLKQESIGNLHALANLGYLLIFAGTFSAAAYVVLSSHISLTLNPLVMIGYQQISAMILALVLLIASLWHGSSSWSNASPEIWTLALISGVLQYSIAFALYFNAVRHIGTSLSGAFLCLVPIFGVTGGWLVLNEAMTYSKFFGAFFAIAAISVMSIHYMPEEEGNKSQTHA